MQNIITSFFSPYAGFSKNTWVATFATFVNSIGASVTLFLSLYLVNIVHLSMDQVGYILSAFGIGIFLGSLLSGYLTVRFDAYFTAIMTLLLNGCVLFLIPFTNHFFALALLAGFVGVFSGIFRPANMSILLQDCFDEDRARGIALNRMAINLGVGTAGFVGGWLAMRNYDWIFWLDGLTSWCAALILIYFFNTLNQKNISKPLITFKKVSLTHTKSIKLIAVLFFLNAMVFAQVISAYPVFIKEYYQLNYQVIGYLFFLNCMLIALFQVPLIHTLKSFNQIWVLIVGSFALCFSLFVLPFGSSVVFAIICCILFTVGEILIFPIINNIFISHAQPTEQSKYLGYYHAIWSAASILGPLLGTFIYSQYPLGLWYICGLIGLISIVGFYFCYRNNQAFEKSAS